MLTLTEGVGRRPRRRTRFALVVAVLSLVLVLLAIFSLGLGRVEVPPGTVVAILAARLTGASAEWPAAFEQIVMNVRLPRIAAAILVGGALAAAGAAYQNLFRNPIVSPDILGVSAGAGFGASLGVMLNLTNTGIQGAAFVGGLTAVALVFAVGQAINRHSLIILVLVGVVVAAFFQAMISVLKIVADPIDVLPVITFWLLGGLNKITPADLPEAGSAIVLALGVLYALRWQINVMSVGADEARTLGVNTTTTRLALVVAATLMTAAAVSIAGIVGWVGLVVPHVARMLVGPGFERLLPVSVLCGSVLLLAVDDVSRAASSMEIPLGITTSVVGAPLFLALLLRARTAWT